MRDQQARAEYARRSARLRLWPPLPDEDLVPMPAPPPEVPLAVAAFAETARQAVDVWASTLAPVTAAVAGSPRYRPWRGAM